MEAQGPLALSLQLDRFRTKICRLRCKNTQRCTDSHSCADTRRRLREYRYGKFLCPTPSRCDYPNCSFAHSASEQLYHPDFYKKEYCGFFANGSCVYGEACAYAHSDYEVRVRPLHLFALDVTFFFFEFKAEFCPFNVKHNKFTCLYAHNWQDYKRPFSPGLLPKHCPNWNTNKVLDSYSEGCPSGMSCRYCHGWKELDYHPARFRQTHCSSVVCDRKSVCSFLHAEQKPPARIDSPFFEIARPAVHYGAHSTQDLLRLVNDRFALSDAKAVEEQPSTSPSLLGIAKSPALKIQKIAGVSNKKSKESPPEKDFLGALHFFS